MTTGEFQSQLMMFKTNLMALYKKKTKLIAGREAMRFNYVTVLKSKWKALLSAIYQDGYAAADSNGVDLFASYISFIQRSIPMANINGTNITAAGEYWGPNPFAMGAKNVGFLSPIEDLISNSLYGTANNNTDLRPPYKIYSIDAWRGSENFLKSTFLANTVYNYSNQGRLNIEVPPSEELMSAYITSNLGAGKAALMSGLPFVQAALTKSYNGVSVADMLGIFRASLKDIMDTTYLILQVQQEIDTVTANLSEFVTEYKDYTGGASLDQILKEIEEGANQADITPPIEESTQTEVLQTAMPVAQPKSKLPWIAAGVVAFAILSRKK